LTAINAIADDAFSHDTAFTVLCLPGPQLPYPVQTHPGPL